MGTPTHIVTGLTAGETVKITVTATVPHPGWYRIALMEGAAASQTLTTIPDPMAMAGTNCTPAIMTNPVWSKTQPVIADGLPAGSVAKTTQSGTKVLTATIPQNANCTTASPCTIQVIMVMTDHPANDCYYHHCADITTSGGSTPDAGTGDGGMSMGGGTATGGTAAGGAKGTGGTVGAGGATASGGVSGSGGATASGGAPATGGSSASGGSSPSGGSTSTGGASAVASGGTTASGGKTGSGGTTSATGGTTASSSGGSSGSGASSNGGGGCSAIPDVGGAPLLTAGASLLALLLARRRNRGSN